MNRRRSYPYPQPLRASRFVIAASILGYYFSRLISTIVLPWGPADPLPHQERPVVTAIDFSNDALTFQCKYLSIVCSGSYLPILSA